MVQRKAIENLMLLGVKLRGYYAAAATFALVEKSPKFTAIFTSFAII
jgi:hypothetical protein